MRKMFRLLLVAVVLSVSFESGDSHGYLTGPRSRNLVAFEETVWWPLTENDPQPETCPHCLNRGGSLAQCGIAQGMRNYDLPKNALGGPMPTKIQANFTQGEEVVLNVTLTAHHRGHFEFAACPIAYGEIPTKECFENNKLKFIEDLIYGANYDSNYPERVYVAPVNDVSYVPNYGTTEGLMDFSFKMLLPPDLYGELVLIQWYYLTANSCIHDGYAEYNWPDGWRNNSISASPCDGVSSDGTGSPEQFWNCGEVRILPTSNVSPLVASPSIQPSISKQLGSVAIPVSLPTTLVNMPLSVGTIHNKTIIGYYASWQWYDRNKLAEPANMDFTKLQRVNFAFFQTDVNGNIWGTDSWADPNVLFGPYNWNPLEGETQYCSWDSPTEKVCNHHVYEKGLIYLVHQAGAQLYPSIGGWTLSDAFPEMASSTTSRAAFAQNCVDLINDYGFDGIDIDWEYPGFEEHSGTSQDTENFNLLLDEVRAKLDELGTQTGKFYGLTAALPCGPSHIDNMDIAHVSRTLSELNLMTYDFHGAFSETTGINAPIYYQGWGEDEFSVDDCVKNWLEGGGTRDKINIGLPFYGRSFAGATGLNQVHDGADQMKWAIDEGTPQYFHIVEQLPSMTRVWDKASWTSWAYFEDGGLVSYDDEDSICAKTDYAIKENLSGFIIWELSGDIMDDLSTPLLDVVNKKLTDPSLSCGEAGYYPEMNKTSSAIIESSPSHANISQSSTSHAETGMSNSILPLNNMSETIPTEYDGKQSMVNATSSSSSTYQTDSRSKILLTCGRSQGDFNIGAMESVELTFTYELHRHPEILASDAIEDVKTSMLDDIAESLLCNGAPSSSVGARRLKNLQSNPIEMIQKYVSAILSQSSDLANNNSPCSIEVNLESPSICDSMLGSLTVFFPKGTLSTVSISIQQEILQLIRTGMASGRYETSKVAKVIYIESLSTSSLKSSSMTVWTPENDGISKSSIIAIILSILLVIVTGIAIALFLMRRKQSVGNAEDNAENSIASNVSQVEEVWRKALVTYEHEPNQTSGEPSADTYISVGSSESLDHSSQDLEAELSQEVKIDEKLSSSDLRGMLVDPPGSLSDASMEEVLVDGKEIEGSVLGTKKVDYEVSMETKKDVESPD